MPLDSLDPLQLHDGELANDTLQSVLAAKPRTRFWELRMHHEPR